MGQSNIIIERPRPGSGSIEMDVARAEKTDWENNGQWIKNNKNTSYVQGLVYVLEVTLD